MNPWSNYHLSFNLGFPNEYDRSHNRTGNGLMVHGRCDSMGCFAMTDNRMEEIYTLTHATLAGGQEAFSVHVFPFRMDSGNMEKFKRSPWFGFWRNLKEGYDFFEGRKQVPKIFVHDGRYVIPRL
jgi:murein L,D-transpeptidase YafK